ncbi:hypothetical protein KC353_g19389, partial [Hortaea werneckii]
MAAGLHPNAAALQWNNQQRADGSTYTSSDPMSPPYNSPYNAHPANLNPQQQQPAAEPPKFLCLNELPRMPSSSPPVSPERRRNPRESPFLRLPTEIRLYIYSLLVLPRRSTDLLPSYEKVHSSTHDYFDYDKKQHGTDRPCTANLQQPTLLIRTLDPDRYRKRYPEIRPLPIRSKYSVRC